MFRSIKINGLLIEDQTDFVLSSSEHSGNINKSLCQDTEKNRPYLVLSHEQFELHSLYDWTYLFLVRSEVFSIWRLEHPAVLKQVLPVDIILEVVVYTGNDSFLKTFHTNY